MWCKFIWNSKKSNDLLLRHFSMFFSWSIYHSSPFFWLNFWAAFFLEHLTVVVSANTCLKVATQKLLKLKKSPEIIYKCEKVTSNRYKSAFSLVSSSNEFTPFTIHVVFSRSILIWKIQDVYVVFYKQPNWCGLKAIQLLCNWPG